MIIDVEVWKAVAKLDMSRVQKFEESTNRYNKMQTYRGMLLDLARNLKNCLGVGVLTAKDRMLVYLIIYILTPRSCKHAQVMNKSDIKMN